MSAFAIIGCAAEGSCHGFKRGSGIFGVSMVIPLTPSKKWSTEFTERSLSVNSLTWALRMAFSASTFVCFCVTRLICIAILPFWFLSSASWFMRSSKCCCFLILDLLADSLFESILFLFLSSIISCGSPSKLEAWRTGKEDILFCRVIPWF